MLVYCIDYNGVITSVITRLKAINCYTENYHEADLFLTWQDVRGDCKEIAEIFKFQNKPVIVVQHGRGATRDYCEPNKFPLIADKICVWGEADKKRLLKVGIDLNRIVVTGCPLFVELTPKNKNRMGINVLFTPIISDKEEPENLMVFAALKKWESEKLLNHLQINFKDFKRAWAEERTEIKPYKLPDNTIENRVWKKQVIPQLQRGITYNKGLINVKITGIHDLNQYLAPLAMSQQNGSSHIKGIIELLANVDVVVSLEEGTLQGLAMALDIPVIICPIYQYGDYGGCKDYGKKVEIIRTPACDYADLNKLGQTLDNVLKHSEARRDYRIKVCEDEFGANLGNQVENVIKTIESVWQSRISHKTSELIAA